LPLCRGWRTLRLPTLRPARPSSAVYGAVDPLVCQITGLPCVVSRRQLAERISAGHAAARARGVRWGRPPAIDDETLDFALHALAERNPRADIAAALGVSERTLIRAIQRRSESNARARARNGGR
jgi:hypothetical protein